MNYSNYEIITELLSEFKEEHDTLQIQIDDTLFKLKEFDYFVKSLLDNEDQEFKIFSPRNAENIYRDEIAKAKADKEVFQKKLDQYYYQKDILHSKIEKLEKIVDEENGFHFDNNVRQRNLTMLNIQEEDRQRIARDLHDTSLQNLAHLVHKIELSSMYIDQDPLKAKLELAVISKKLKSIIEDIRKTIFNLRPMSFDDLGLKSTFEQLLQKINENNKYEIHADIDDVSCENNLVFANIFRVVQECFVNITKHADATKIFFSFKNNNNICIIDIKDNGKGFTEDEIISKQEDRHFGVILVKERINLLGGRISINSEIKKGTHIHMEIPL